MDSWKATAPAIPRCVCDTVFYQHHDNLRHLLNFHSIYPCLNARRLLPSGLDQSRVTSPTITTEQRIDLMLSWIPKSDHPDYLSPFLESLLESVEQAGEAHRELATMMEAQLEREMEKFAAGNYETERDGPSVKEEDKSRCGQKDESSPLLQGIAGHSRNKASPACKTKRRALKSCMACSTVFLLIVTVAWVITTALFLKITSGNLNSRQIDITGSATIMLGSGIRWLESFDLLFSDKRCMNASVVIMEESSCSEQELLMETVHLDAMRETWYALPESSIQIHVPSNSSEDKNAHIWITTTIEARDGLATSDGPICDQLSRNSDAYCFHAHDHTGEMLTFNISKPGFYFVRVLDQDDRSGPATWVTFSADILSYNFSDINESSAVVKSFKVNRNRLSPLRVNTASHLFSFKSSCVLLSYDCDGFNRGFHSTITISNLRYRWDIVVLAFTLYLPCAILSVGLAIAGTLLCPKLVKQRRRRL